MEKKNITIGMLLIMLAGTSSFALYDKIDLSQPKYYCENKVELGALNCVRFSTAGTTCYPYELNNTGQKYCSVGWTEIIKGQEIPKENAVDNTVKTKKEICSPLPNYGCVPIEE